MKYRADIDGLRAVAVSAVVIFHVFPSYLPGGFVGVDIFFVISGYLISSIICNELSENSFSFKQFYFRRVRRIFPTLILVLVTSYLIGWYLLTPEEYRRLGTHLVAASLFSSNFLLSKESGYFDDAANTKPLLHLWSLAIEEQFYIVWPIILYAVWKSKQNLRLITLLLTLFSFLLNTAYIQVNRVQTFYWPITRAWELLIGACLAVKSMELFKQFILSKYNERLHNIISVIGTFLICTSMLFLTKTSVFPGWWAAVPTLGTALIISAGPMPWINKNILSSYLFVEIGRISYPLYLWHWPLLIFLTDLLSIRLLIILFSIIIAFLSYMWIEKPFRFGKFLQMKFVSLCIGMVMIGLVGYKTYECNGLPYRFPTAIRDVLNYGKHYQNSFDSYRKGTCFLDIDQDELQFGACTDNKQKSASDDFIIWGDSHAAHLYPGIKAMNSVRRITQLTASRCPPILHLHSHTRPHCKQINDFVFKSIVQDKPNTILMAADWSRHKWTFLDKTFSILRNTSVKNIYLVGPVPRWKKKLPLCLFDHFSRDSLGQIPTRLKTCLETHIENLDKLMEEFVGKFNIKYISPYRILCSSNGCLSMVPGKNNTLTMYDECHLSITASAFVVSHFSTDFLRLLRNVI